MCTCKEVTSHAHALKHTYTFSFAYTNLTYESFWLCFQTADPPSLLPSQSLSLSVSLHHLLPHFPSFPLALPSPSNPLSNHPCHRWMRQTAAVLMLLPVSLWALSNHWAWAELNWQFVIVRHRSLLQSGYH